MATRTFDRQYLSNGNIDMLLVYSILIIGCSARGPHHPGGGINNVRAEHQKHITEHINIQLKYVDFTLFNGRLNRRKISISSENDLCRNILVIFKTN